MNKTKLTAAIVNAYPLPADGATIQWDTTDGLLLRVSATGAKTWCFYRHNPNTGKPIKRSLGKWPKVQVEQARKAARELQLSLDKGEVATTSTLAALVDKYENNLRARGEVKNVGYVRRLYELSWAGIGNKRLDKITAEELETAHNQIAAERGKAAAARAIRILRMLFAYAIELDLVAKNPAKKVRTAEGVTRDVFLTPAELAIFRAVLAEQPRDFYDYFTILLMTGVRRGTAAAMRWQDAHGDVWVIPREASKNKKSYEVPLLPVVQAILAQRRNDSEWVFPTWSSTGHLRDPWSKFNIVRRKCAAKGLVKHFTMHDLRRTFATQLTAAGVPLTVVSKALGHRNVQTTPIYARADTATVRAAMEKLV